MSDITNKINQELRDGNIQIKYTPFYLTAFTNPIQSYSKEDGQIITQSFSVADLNAGKITKVDSALLKTKGRYEQDGFSKFLMATQTNISDFESATLEDLSSQILTKYEIFNDKIALNGDTFNKGLIRSVETYDYKLRTASLPTTIGGAIVDIGTALGIANRSSNEVKRLIPLGTFKTFLYSETSTGSGVLNITLLQSRFSNIQFINTDDVFGIPTGKNGYLLYTPSLGHIKMTGNGPELSKSIPTVTGTDYVYINGSIGAYFENEASAVLTTIV